MLEMKIQANRVHTWYFISVVLMVKISRHLYCFAVSSHFVCGFWRIGGCLLVPTSNLMHGVIWMTWGQWMLKVNLLFPSLHVFYS